MIVNQYENTRIKNKNLPESWRSQKGLDDLNDFLQQNWEQRSVFFDDEQITSKQQFLDFTGQKGVRTKNYIGTIVFEGEQLNIFPKMFKTDIDDHDTGDLDQQLMMNNLIRWLDYCHRVEYPFISISSELDDANNLRDFFVTLYIGYVRSALARQPFYHYVEETSDCPVIKGKIDITDYFTKKLPNGEGNLFRCSYSEFEFDNLINRIIKYTCHSIYYTTNKKNQKTLRTILTKLDGVSLEVCSPADCSKIRLNEINSIYRIIVSMSKMFLLNQTSNYSMDLNESFCFLFPTELLFEGFIGGYLQEIVADFGGNVHLQQSDMHLMEDIVYNGESLGPAFMMRHDILVEIGEKAFILDTKYKQVSRFEGNPDEVIRIVREEPKQTDIYQVCEYARKRNISDVYLLYPMFRFENEEPSFPVGISKSPNGDINVHFIRLPFIFEEDEDKTHTMLKKVIMRLLIDVG